MQQEINRVRDCNFLLCFKPLTISLFEAFFPTDIRSILVDLKTRKSTGTSCQIEIHFSSQTSKFLIKYNLLRFQISGGLFY